MTNFKLKKGVNLSLKGAVTSNAVIDVKPASFAIIPDDFTGIIPRLDVKEGAHVLAGEPIFHDKNFPEIKITAPVSGTVKAIVRGDRRKISAIVIAPDNTGNKLFLSKDYDAKQLLLDSGLWGCMRQRPYDIVPSPEVKPRDIFITAFDSAPLAPDFALMLKGKEEYLQKGIDALATLTDGKVYLGCRPDFVINARNCEVCTFEGPHPAGNVGVQIANVKPVNKGEVVWTLNAVSVARLGELIATGHVPYDTIVAITGESIKEPKYIRTTIGADLKTLIGGNIENPDNARIISGNVLTGAKSSIDGYLQFPFRHVTVIPEIKNDAEFMGWASLSPKKFSLYHSFTRWLFGANKPAEFDAKLNGGERAIIMSGEYDRMLPMDIYAEFLIKAIIAFDIDKMEQLGIYEVAPEDFALCEFADTSKLELQRIVREGLDKLRKEMN